jgi:hypothetical protein
VSGPVFSVLNIINWLQLEQPAVLLGLRILSAPVRHGDVLHAAGQFSRQDLRRRLLQQWHATEANRLELSCVSRTLLRLRMLSECRSQRQQWWQYWRHHPNASCSASSTQIIDKFLACSSSSSCSCAADVSSCTSSSARHSTASCLPRTTTALASSWTSTR